MANSFFNFVTSFVSRTVAKSGPHNDRFVEVQSGFAAVEAVTKSALRIAGYSTSTPITATPNSFVQLNASGLPVASGTMSFSPNMGGYRVQNVGNASIGTDATNYGQMTGYVATIAFGSPNVLVVPAFAGKSLQTLRLNTGETALEFANTIPVPTSSQADYLVTSGGAWVQSRSNPNLLLGGGLMLDVVTPYAWTLEPSGVITSRGDSGIYMGRTLAAVVGGVIGTSAIAYTPLVTPFNAYTASVSFKCATAAPVVTMYMEFYAISSTLLSSSSVELTGNNGTGVTKRYSLTATAPATALRVKIYFSVGAESYTNADDLQISRVKFEKGSVATPWNDDATVAFLSGNASRVVVTGAYSVDMKIGVLDVGGPQPQTISFNSSAVGVGNGFLIEAQANATGVALGGNLRMYGRRLIMPTLSGFSAVYDNGNTGATKTIDWVNGQKQKATVNGNTAFTITALDSTIVVDGLRLMLQKDATATTFTPTFASAATLKWKGNTIPAALTVANQEMEIIFWWDGSRFVGSWQFI